MVPDALWVSLLTEHGPWVLLVFLLLFKDHKKDETTRAALHRNTEIIIELTTLIRERLPGRAGGEK
ncbi:hypothetical protein SAMN05444002_1126 [Vannielia litorea]|uniref:Uncharacterized protein n=1 Tax=Vannielia litorea TaxID=1217970 RepID=A0A1N6EV13_9RHOB|nr:hypothetical protein SAMN05444002_1126 [Vannielia litorea]